MSRAGTGWSDRREMLACGRQQLFHGRRLHPPATPDHGQRSRPLLTRPRHFDDLATIERIDHRQTRNQAKAGAGRHQARDRADAADLGGAFWRAMPAAEKPCRTNGDRCSRLRSRRNAWRPAPADRPAGYEHVVGGAIRIRGSAEIARRARRSSSLVVPVEAEGDIDLTVFQLAQQLAAARDFQPQLDVGMASLENPTAMAPAGPRRWFPARRSSPIPALVSGSPSLDSGAGLVGQQQNVFGIGFQRAAGRRQLQALLRAREQARATELGFKRLDLIADARLREVDFLERRG